MIGLVVGKKLGISIMIFMKSRGDCKNCKEHPKTKEIGTEDREEIDKKI